MLSRRYASNRIPSIKLNEIQQHQQNQIQNHIDSGLYKFETVSCLICGQQDYEQLSEKDRYGLYAPTVICNHCGLVQAMPRMTQNTYDHFYNDGHRRLYVGKETPDEAYFNGRYQAGKETFEYLSQYLEINGSRVLEVGCGAGSILKYLHDSGATVTGIDLSHEYLEYGRNKYQLDLRHVNLFDLPNDEQYDLIIYSDVLEHILDPKEHLAKIKNLLSPDGLLYIKVPGLKNTYWPYLADFLKSLQNAHVYYYSLSTLTNLMVSCGFYPIRGDEDIRSLWHIAERDGIPDEYANDYTDAMNYLQKLETQIMHRKLLPLFKWLQYKLRRLSIK